jgi:hypothetical protein
MEAFESISRFPEKNSPEDVAFKKKFDENNKVSGENFEYFDFLRSLLLKFEILPLQKNLEIYKNAQFEEN